jgi:hypothetical protein
MLSAAGNNAVSDSDPTLYLPKCAETLGASADSVFESNFMPRPSAFDYGHATYRGFLEERSRIVTQVVDKLCSGDHL